MIELTIIVLVATAVFLIFWAVREAAMECDEMSRVD